MDRFGILNSDNSADDQILETDIMRFMAIIGIVFWIIFSIVKSMPVSAPVTGPSSVVQTSSTSVEPKPLLQPPVAAKPHTAPRKSQPEPAAARQPASPSPAPSKAVKSKNVQPSSAPIQGLRLQFKSLNAVLTLLKNHQLNIFCRAKATGFDLIFEGRPEGGTIRFHNAEAIPRQLWEIKDGAAHTYFLDKIAKTYPAIRTFPQKQVLVSFTDKALENSVINTLDRLSNTGKNGVLSVTGTGKVIFRASPTPSPVSPKPGRGASE